MSTHLGGSVSVFRMQIHRIVSSGSRCWSSPLLQPPGKLQSLSWGQQSCSFTAWSASRGCLLLLAMSLLSMPGRRWQEWRERSPMLCSACCVSVGLFQTPTADHQAKSSQHPTAAFAFTKPLLAASPTIFLSFAQMWCSEIML